MYQFTRIPNHTRLYTLIAFLHPWDKNGIVLGDLELTSKCVTSTYGDKKLFFRHQYIEDDVKLYGHNGLMHISKIVIATTIKENEL